MRSERSNCTRAVESILAETNPRFLRRKDNTSWWKLAKLYFVKQPSVSLCLSFSLPFAAQWWPLFSLFLSRRFYTRRYFSLNDCVITCLKSFSTLARPLQRISMPPEANAWHSRPCTRQKFSGSLIESKDARGNRRSMRVSLRVLLGRAAFSRHSVTHDNRAILISCFFVATLSRAV